MPMQISGGDQSWIAATEKRISFGPKTEKEGIRFKKSIAPLLEKIFVEVFGRIFKQNFAVAKIGKSHCLVCRNSMARFILDNKDMIKGLHSDNKSVQKLIDIVNGTQTEEYEKNVKSAMNKLGGRGGWRADQFTRRPNY